VKALAHVLHYAHGVPVRKVPALFGARENLPASALQK